MKTVFPNLRILLYLCLAVASVLFLIAIRNNLQNDAPIESVVVRDVRIRNRIVNPISNATAVNANENSAVRPPPEQQVAPHAAALDFDDEIGSVKKNGDVEAVGDGAIVNPPKLLTTATIAAPEDANKGVVAGPDDDDAMKRNQIKEMLRFAWQGYRNYSWGANELRPVSKGAHSQSIFGGNKMAATIVDAADSLYIMGLTKEYEEARDFIRNQFDIKLADGTLSVFETTIRFVGGLLTLFAMTGDEFYKTKAAAIADSLMPAFNTNTGIALSLVDPNRGTAQNYAWAAGGSSVLAEFGSLHLEFAYLSHITGDKKYLEKVKKIRDVLDKADKPKGLYPNYMGPNNGQFTAEHVSLGAMGDSFYEYLIKSYVLTNKTDEQALRMHKNASEAIQANMVFKSKSGLRYIAELRTLRTPEHKMGHLACFTPGMFALESVYETNATRKASLMQLAEDLGHTCHESYIRTKTHIGPEMFFFNDFDDATAKRGEQFYILRPEVLEGFFYLWRLTGNQKYKDWIWDAVLAFEKYCRTEAGYSGIRDVHSDKPAYDDVQQSFFLAETLKYAYLAFDDNALPLDKFVFNTEAHPLPIWQPDPITGL